MNDEGAGEGAGEWAITFCDHFTIVVEAAHRRVEVTLLLKKACAQLLSTLLGQPIA